MPAPSNMNTGEARVIDPILSSHARGYRHAGRVGHLLFPYVAIPLRGVKRLEFGKESFRLYSTARAPGAATKRIRFGYEGKPVVLEQHSLEGQVPFEHQDDAAIVPGVDMAASAVNIAMASISLYLEYLQAKAATTPSHYAGTHRDQLSGSDQWSHKDSDPKAHVKAAKETVRSTIGLYPNTLILSAGAFDALDDHPKILDKFKYTSSDSVTVEMLANYFKVGRVAVAESVFAGDDDQFRDVWGNSAVLAYVPPAGLSWEVPSYGYTYRLDGSPYVEQPYAERNAKSWIYPVTDEYSPELVGPEAGFLFTDVVAAS